MYFNPTRSLLSTLACAIVAHSAHAVPPTVHVGQDNIKVTASCTLIFDTLSINDADGNGIVHIEAPADATRIEVDLGGAVLVGGLGAPETLKGIGIAIKGKNVTLRNGSIRGFKIGVAAESCDGLVLEDLNTSDNYAQALLSQYSQENTSDWLFPHANDGGEWITQHGAGIAVQGGEGVTIRRVKSHRTQNGIVLDRVKRSNIYDNDCSFLSGWGIAMWRSSGNTVCRNSLDFCVRGYSHGIYNRGQDSAGLLMFEQCCDNIIALNSATHCGDGIFGFAGREALGETPCPSSKIDFNDPEAWYRGRGCNGNRFIDNDLSYAAAHGLEMTFSFGNLIARNRFDSNAICGIWAGYARETIVVGNDFIGNGNAGYGSERGGVNMEHAQRCVIEDNAFSNEPVGVQLWTDADEALAKRPWVLANGAGAINNRIVSNRFTDMEKAAQIIAAKDTVFVGNTLLRCATALAQTDSIVTRESGAIDARVGPTDAQLDAIIATLPGTNKPRDTRSSLRGRDKIIMLDHGPYAWDRPIVVQVGGGQARPKFKAYGFMKVTSTQILGQGALFVGLDADGVTIEVATNQVGYVTPFIVMAIDPLKKAIRASGLLVRCDWLTKFFPLDSAATKLGDVPDLAAFRALALAEPRAFTYSEIDFDFRGRSLQDAVGSAEVTLPDLGTSRFGITASTSMRFPAGNFRVHVLSDDGVRLAIDGKPVIERWNIHGQTEDTFAFDLLEPREMQFDLDYFQNSGASRLRVWFEAIKPKILG